MKRLFDPRDPLLSLRLATAIAGAIAILALFSVSGVTEEPHPGVLIAMGIGLIGQYVSHRLRGKSLWVIKAVLAVSMIVLLWRYMANLISNLQDTRYPLAELLLYLAVINSFDLPRRHNLRIAMMVSVILLVVTATLSRDMTFGLYLLAFLAAGLWWGHQDMLSELGASPEQAKASMPAFKGLVPIGAFILAGGLALLLTVPREEGGGFKQLPFSTMLTLPSHIDPQVRNPAYPAGSGGRNGASEVNPEAYYGFSEDLDLNYRGKLSETVALKVRSPRRQFWRGMAYDTFDGRSWRMSRPHEVQQLQSNPFTLPSRAQEGGGRPEITTFYVEKNQTNLILMPDHPTQLYFPTGVIMADPYDAYRSPILLEKGMYYTVVARRPMPLRGGPDRELPPPERLKRTGLDLAPYLALPPSFSARTRELTQTLTAGAAGPRERLARIEAYLETTYPYDLSIPAFPGQADQLDHFLFEAKRGYCEHFATALALMGREAGVPTRLVTGYLPGDFNPFTGFYEVKTAHAHAWVEAYLWGRGWVALDPTPGFAGPGEVTDGLSLPLTDWARALGGHTTPVMAGIGAIALGGGLLWIWKARRRRPRVSEASVAYLKLVAIAGRIGGFPTEGLTPRELLVRISEEPELKAIAPEAEALVTAYEAVRFGGAPDDGAISRALESLEARLQQKAPGFPPSRE
ncbi:Protein-glutamine gamma-glutamyltransferase [compost metagenome]